MGRRRKKQDGKYKAQFSKTRENKLRKFMKHHPKGEGTIPTVKSSRGGAKEKIV